jgi:hypothetical protein
MSEKTYRAIRHDVVRKKQRENDNSVHHPDEKIAQVEFALKDRKDLKILELFAGQGNLTKVYENYGQVFAYDKKHLKTGDSFIEFHKLIGEKM